MRVRFDCLPCVYDDEATTMNQRSWKFVGADEMSRGCSQDGVIRELVALCADILLWHFCWYCARWAVVVYAAFRVVLCRAAGCIIITITITITTSSSSNWITASRPLQLHCQAGQYLKRDRRRRLQPLNPARPVLNTDVRPARSVARPFYWRRMPIHTSRGGGRADRTAAGPARTDGEGQGEAGVRGRKNGSTWKPVNVQQRETMTETWFTRRRRRRIISPRQYCLSFSFYSPVVAHVRPSFL